MSYPAAPWILRGHALQTLNLVDIERVRSLIPAELNIVSVFPGKTLGGVYVSHYGPGSILQYNELIVVAGLVSRDGNIGPWISHIYVDNSDSVAGGREIWGLPKELAEFKWQYGDPSSVTVQQGEKILCSVRYGKPFSFWRQALAGTSFSHLDSDLLLFTANANLRPGLTNATLNVPLESPFRQLELQQPWLTFSAEEMQLTVNQPTGVGQIRQEYLRDRPRVYQ